MSMKKSWLLFLVMSSMVLTSQTVAFRWVENWRFKGFGTSQTAPFKLFGKEWRINYKPSGQLPFNVMLCNVDSGAMVEITDQKGRGDALPGRETEDGSMELAYLQVTGEQCKWEMIVSQYMDLPREWQCRKWVSPVKKLVPFGSWSGSEGDKSWSLEFKDKMGRMTFTQGGEGRFEVEVIDESGRSIAKMVSLGAGSFETWFYKPGVYTIRVSAIQTAWNLHVETVGN